MTFNLGTAQGRISLTYDGKGAQQAKDDIDQLQQGSSKSSDALNDMANAAGASGLTIAAGLAYGVNAAADFEQRMSAIGAVSGATGDEFDALRDKALQLGKDTSFSASEAALAIEELVKSGMSVPDVMNGAADATVALAAAGEIALPEAAAIASAAMNQFGVEAERMPEVADLFAGAANASATGVSELGQALQQVGAVANLAGVSLEDTTAAIALMANAGIQGSDAGTSLKSMFSRLNPSTKEATKEMERLGIITETGKNRFYDAEGNMKSLADVSQILKGSLKGMSAEQKQAALQTLFGSDAIRAAAIMSEEGAAGFNKMTKEMGEVSAADVAAKRLDNFKGSIEAMKGSLETAAITIGTVLLPFLREIVDGVTTVANAFLNLSPPIQQAILAFVAIAGGLLLAVAAFLKIKAAIMAGSAVMTLFTGPIGLVIALIAALVAAFIYFYKTNASFREFVQQAAAVIKDLLARAIEYLVPLIKRAIPYLMAAGKAIGEFLGKAIKAIVPVIMDFAGIIRDRIVPAIIKLAQTVLPALKDAWAEIAPKIKPAIDAFMSFASTLAGVLIPVIKTVIGVLMEWYKFFLAYIIPIILKLAGIFLTYLLPVISGVISAILTILTGLWTFLQGLINFVVGVFTGDWGRAWEGIKQIFSGIITVIKGIAMALWASLKQGFKLAWAVIKAATGAVWGAIKAVLTGIWNGIKGAASGFGNAVKNAVVGAWNAVKTATSTAWNAVKNAVRDKITEVITLVKGIKDKVLGALSGAASWLYDKGKEIIQGLVDGVLSAVDKVQDAVSKVADVAGKFLPGSPVREGPLKVLNHGYAGRQIVQMVIDGITAQTGALSSASDGMAGALAPAVAVGGSGGVASPAKPSAGVARLVEGELLIDESGRAFIRGLAVDADDDESDYEDTLGRMNR